MKNDALLWYNVPGWEQHGLAVPNFGDDTGTQNNTILYLSQVIGRNLQGIMFHSDARSRIPPTINTVMRISKLCVRARAILSARAVPSNVLRMEPAHAIPANEQFVVYPCPYFNVRNGWLKEYAGLILTALTECFQHTENGTPLEISQDFAGVIGQYIQRVYRSLGTELLQLDPEKFKDPSYTIADADFTNYNPGRWFTSTEMLDTPPMEFVVPTEDDLKILTDGIAVNQLPPLGRYLSYPNPQGVQTTNTNGSGGSGSSTVASTGSFLSPPSP